ncbi:MAG TPA: glycosyltransferase family 2 protein [Acidimicrobiales bacterium]|nr:glycosyltransferase family 2 protein [Acidimicrobiales bacterium]
MEPKPLLSVVAPVYCEEEGIASFYERTTRAVEAIDPPVDHELVFVNDGSTDDTLSVLRKLADDDSRVRIVDLSRNFGHQVAITSGMDHARGDAVVVIDADLQDPPEVIADMVEKWRDGFKVVYGVRTRRSGETGFKVLTAKYFYRLLNRISDTNLPLDSGDFRLLDKQVIQALCEIREENRYIRGLVAWIGFAQTGVYYERDPRYAGESKFTVRKMLRFAADAVTSFSEKPLRFATQVGLFVTTCTLLLALWIIASRVLSPQGSFPGFASLMVVVLFLGGVQLLSIGLLGEYVGRIYRESKRRPLYIVAERVNFDDES